MIKKIFRFIFQIIFWLFIGSIALVLLYKWVPLKVTPLMVIRYFENEPTNKTFWKHDWIPIDGISENLKLAVICSEDQNFLKHSGFDYKAIKKAIDFNRQSKTTRGASTISQQTAKNVFLWQQRTWFRKILETYFTVLIEFIWPKERILEAYLNSIEMGKGIYGAKAAAQHWFNKQASQLTIHEAAAIASILPNPTVYKARQASAYIQSRKVWIVSQMKNFGTLEFKDNHDRPHKY